MYFFLFLKKVNSTCQMPTKGPQALAGVDTRVQLGCKLAHTAYLLN